MKLEEWIKSPRKSKKKQKIRKLRVGPWGTAGTGRRLRENSHMVTYWQRVSYIERTSYTPHTPHLKFTSRPNVT